MSVEVPSAALESQASEPGQELEPRQRSSSTFERIAKYTIVKIVMLFLTVGIAVYLTIMIANLGGYVDELMRGSIREFIALGVANDPSYLALAPEDQANYINNQIALAEERLGLNKPFAQRAFAYLVNAMKLDLGRAQFMSSDTGSRQVRLIILERLAPTLLLLGTANLIIFFGSIALALGLSRQYGSFWDKLIIALSPTSSAPSWFYGLFFILIFAAIIPVLPFGGMLDTPPPQTQLGYALSVAKHLILPVGAVVTSAAFVSIYNWRTFFLIYSSEDYVEMAKAKGLNDSDIQSRYILRPTLPTIITNFALIIISVWQGTIITEAVFVWPGLGQAILQAIGSFDTAVIVGVTIIYSYLLAITVFLLDIIYALVDPRVKIGSGA